MNDYSTTLTGTPVQVVPDVYAGRRQLTIFAPGVPNSVGGNGDIIYSFSLTGSALAPGAAGTFYLAGGQSITYGGQPGLFAPPGAVWMMPVRGNSAPVTVMVIMGPVVGS